MSPQVKSAVTRALRTYLQVVVPALLTLLTDAGPVQDIEAWKVALWSGVPALVAFLWRLYLDPSSVPSLVDKNVDA